MIKNNDGTWDMAENDQPMSWGENQDVPLPLLWRLRYFLLRLLAGDAAVIVNVRLMPIATCEDDPPVFIDNMFVGVLVSDVDFVKCPGLGIKISGKKRL